MLHDVTPIERNIAPSTRHRGCAIKNELFWDDILILTTTNMTGKLLLLI